MKRSIGCWQLMGFGVTAFGGTLLHFLYDWSGRAIWVAPFSGVNESTWEHMKLLFWPTFLYTLVQSFFFIDIKNFWCIKLKSIFVGLLLIPVLFYTYNGAIDKSPDWLNIAIFFISAAIMYAYEAKHFSDETTSCKHPELAFYIFILIAFFFVLFTFKTPEIGIFKDPLTSMYGI